MHEIEVRINELGQLFNPIDPAPLPKRDIAPRIEEFIVDWAKELPRNSPISLVLDIDTPSNNNAIAAEAIHEYFRQRALTEHRKLKDLFRRGKTSLLIGTAFLVLTLISSNLINEWQLTGGMLELIRSSLVIAGWVAMWRPMEIFLYEWWPIRAEIKLSERLATMPIRIAD